MNDIEVLDESCFFGNLTGFPCVKVNISKLLTNATFNGEMPLFKGIDIGVLRWTGQVRPLAIIFPISCQR